MRKEKRDSRLHRKKIRWKLVVPFLVLITLILYIVATLMFPHKVEVIQPKYNVCDYNLTKAQAVFKDMSYTETEVLAEHLYYGETLNVFNQPFELGKVDPFVGKTIILRDLCDNTEFIFPLEQDIDLQIYLDTLPEGFYEVFVRENNKEIRLISTEVFYDEFFTIRRLNGLGTEVEVIADKDLIESPIENQTIFDKNYVFIRVIEKEVPSDIYDVVIDPARNYEKGDSSTINGVEIATALLNSAMLLKEKLEAYGLKVYITHGPEIVDRWGLAGRYAKSYTVKAKYYLTLDLDSNTNPNKRGASIYYSNYTSNRFPTAIFDSYLDLHEMLIEEGTGTGILTKSLDTFMDPSPDIRETGGKILGAAKYRGDSSLNASFAKDNPYGAQSLVLYMLYISSPYDLTIYQTQHDMIIENIALGFADYLQLKKVTQ